MIEENTMYQVYLVNPDYIDAFFGEENDNTFWNFFFIQKEVFKIGMGMGSMR